MKVYARFVPESEQETGMLKLMKVARPEIKTEPIGLALNGEVAFLLEGSLADVTGVGQALCDLEGQLAKIKMTRPGK